MIKLDLEPYCGNCPNFEPEVEVITIETGYGELVRYDSFVKCENASKCRNMMRYLRTEEKRNDV